MHPVLLLAGPTASGKSGLALEIAARVPAVIINADSLQLYDGLPLLTAQPSREEKEKAPHALYAALPPDAPCSAARWRNMALAEIEKAQAAGKLPLITGGTGFYLKALTHGLSPLPEVPPEYREKAIALHNELGTAAFHEALKKRDPETAAKIDPANPQRNIRAWEVLEATGKPLAQWHAAPPEPPPSHLNFLTVHLLPPRATLYASCERRFDAMMAAGALEEAAAFNNEKSPLAAALGYHELRAHLAGALSLPDAVAAAKQATRNYAKRQTTWLRNQSRPDLALEAPDPDAVLSLVPEGNMT